MSNMSEDDKKGSVTQDVTNQRRGGTYMKKHHVDTAAANPDRTQQFYDNAANAKDIQTEEYWLARVFNTKEIAKTIASEWSTKETKGGVFSVDDLDQLSKSLVSGRSSRANRGEVVSADTTKSDIQTSPDKENRGTTTNKIKFLSIRDDTRTPDEIFGSNQLIDLLYKEVAKEWPGSPKNQMVLTYILFRSNTAHLYKAFPNSNNNSLYNSPKRKSKVPNVNLTKLPFYSQVLKIAKQIEKDGYSVESRQQFCRVAEINPKMYDKVMKFLSTKAADLAGDL